METLAAVETRANPIDAVPRSEDRVPGSVSLSWNPDFVRRETIAMEANMLFSGAAPFTYLVPQPALDQVRPVFFRPDPVLAGLADREQTRVR